MTKLAEHFDLTLPHEREVFKIVELCYEAYQDENALILCMTDHDNHVQWLAKKVRDCTFWDIPNTKLHRHGIEVKGGGKILFLPVSQPERLHGMKPTKVVLFGRIGELFYFLNSFLDCKIEAVA